MEQATVDITSDAFAARLAAILRAARHDQERSLRALARASRGSFRSKTLKELEAGRANLRGLDLAALASLYQLDLGALLQQRVPLVVDVSAGTIVTAGVARNFEPGEQDGLLLAYLHLVRDLRDLQAERSITLRREDVEVLAAGLRADAAAVLDRLGELMGSTVTQRRSAVAMFVAGAALIVVSTGAIALEPGLYQQTADGEDAGVAAVVTLAAADYLGDDGGMDDGGKNDGGDLGGGGGLTGGPEPVAELWGPSTGEPATASRPASPAPGSSAAPPVVHAPPVVAAPPVVHAPPVVAAPPSATPGVPPAGSGGEAPVGGDPIVAEPVVDSPAVDPPPSESSAPDLPDEVGAAPGAPSPGGSVPPADVPAADEPVAGGPPVDGPPIDSPPADVPPVDVPPADVPPVDELPIDGPPVDGLPQDLPQGDVPPVNVETGTDAPPVNVETGTDAPPVNVETGTDVPPVDAPPVDAPPVGLTPGNSPEAGNTPKVGQPGNSGTTNAGGHKR